MRRRLTIAAFAMLLLALGVSLVCLARAKVRIRQAALEDATDEMLDRRLPEVKFDNTPLDAAIETLRNEAHANIIVHWRALEAASIDRSTPVSLHLRDVRLSKVLQDILNDAGGGNVVLQYQAMDGEITISTSEELNRMVVLRLYDVTDLMAMSVAAEQRLGPLDPPIVESGDPGNREQLGSPYRPTGERPVDVVIKLIEELVAPETWTDAGGEFGWIREWHGRLFITATPENQKRVANLLQQLRESFRRGGKIERSPAPQ